MRFQRIGGPARQPAKKAPPRRPSLPEITRAAEEPPRATAARRDRGPVKVSSYAAVSVTLSVLLFGFFLLGDRGVLEVRRQHARLAELQAEVSALAAENEQLEREVARLKSDPSAVEKIAREELNFVKPGDVVLVLPPGWREKVGVPAPTATPEPTAPAPR